MQLIKITCVFITAALSASVASSALAASCNTPVQCYEKAIDKLDEARRTVASQMVEIQKLRGELGGSGAKSTTESSQGAASLYLLASGGKTCKVACNNRCVVGWTGTAAPYTTKDCASEASTCLCSK